MGNIVFENKDVIIYRKDPGEDSEKLSVSLGREVNAINRLDKPVSGLVCLALNPKAAAFINSQVQDKTFTKAYYAVILGRMESEEATLEDLLLHDKRANKGYVVKRERKGVKKASLEYVVEKEFMVGDEYYSLLRIKLHTGRTHQIRIQFSSRKHPLVGDGKYGSRVKTNIRLLSAEIGLILPGETEKRIFSIPYDESFVEF